MTNFLYSITVALCAAGLTVTAAGAETFDQDGKGHGSNENEVFPISDGNAVIKTSSVYEGFDVAEGHPLQGATGPCFGAAMVRGAEVSGSGNCVYDTASGDKAVISWTATGLGADGALTGDWSVSGGTGAWASASGGGTFSSLTDPDTGKFVNSITGEITME